MYFLPFHLKDLVLNILYSEGKSLLIASLSSWYPTINLTGNGLPQYLVGDQYRNSSYTSTPDTKSKQWSAALSVQIKWNLIDPKRVPEIAAARDSYEKAMNSYLIQLRNLRLQALRQYFLLQRADEGVRIGKESMKASLISLRDSKARYKAGVATKLEVLEAETQLARDKQMLARKLGDQKIARRNLARTLNLPPDVTPTASSQAKIIGLWEPTLQESIVAAFRFREELDRIILDISINNSNANRELAAVQPIISLSNSYNATRTEGQSGLLPKTSVDWRQHGWSSNNIVGLGFTWNIFDGGRAWAQYRQNKQKAQQSEFEFAAKRDQVRLEVEQSFFNLRASNQDIKTTSIGVLSSRESLRLARLRFQAGVTTQREVVNNQRDLKQAQTLYADAMLKYNQSMIQLRRRTGLDQIAACDSLELSNKKPKDDLFDSAAVPIKPSPFTPACKASILQAE